MIVFRPKAKTNRKRVEMRHWRRIGHIPQKFESIMAKIVLEWNPEVKSSRERPTGIWGHHFQRDMYLQRKGAILRSGPFVDGLYADAG